MNHSAKKRRKSKHPLFSILHQEIITGKYQPGDRLPNRTELEKDFDASSLTVQRVLDRLKEDGFITAKSGLGTFVSQTPPHLCTFGIALPATWRTVRYYCLLRSTAESIQANSDNIFFNFYEDMDSGVDSKYYSLLCEDILMHRLAGIFFATVPPTLFAGTPIMEEENMARIALCTPEESMDLPLLNTDKSNLYDKAFNYFKSKGRKRVAVICEMNIREKMKKLLPDLLDKYKLDMEPFWLLSPDRDTDSTAAVVQLLLSSSPEKRPDAIFSTSEMFYAGLTRGIIQSKIKLSEELEIVSHYNFPASAEKMIPMRRIGFNLEEILKKIIVNLQKQRTNTSYKTLRISPKFEDEFELNNKNQRGVEI